MLGPVTWRWHHLWPQADESVVCTALLNGDQCTLRTLRGLGYPWRDAVLTLLDGRHLPPAKELRMLLEVRLGRGT
jgi:hypothetical protein